MDIASVAKCSQNTVALALRGSSRISEQRRSEILRLAKEMGYRPNLAARSLRRGRSGLIGIFTAELDLPRTAFVQEMISKLHTTIYKPILGTDLPHTQPWYEASWIQTFLQLQVEALVSFAWHDKPRLPEWHDQVPIIMSGNQPDPSLPCDSVSVDRSKGARLGVEYLLSRGHRRIAMVQQAEAWQYPDGYTTTMKEAGLSPQIWVAGEGESVSALNRRFLREIKQSDNAPTAVFVVDSKRAGDLCLVALNEGLDVPGDLAVVGCGFLPWADSLRIALTTVERPIEELVATTIQVTRDRLENPKSSPMHVHLPYRLRVRASS